MFLVVVSIQPTKSYIVAFSRGSEGPRFLDFALGLMHSCSPARLRLQLHTGSVIGLGLRFIGRVPKTALVDAFQGQKPLMFSVLGF